MYYMYKLCSVRFNLKMNWLISNSVSISLFTVVLIVMVIVIWVKRKTYMALLSTLTIKQQFATVPSIWLNYVFTHQGETLGELSSNAPKWTLLYSFTLSNDTRFILLSIYFTCAFVGYFYSHFFYSLHMRLNGLLLNLIIQFDLV